MTVEASATRERLAYRRDYRARMAQLLREGIAAGEIPNQSPDPAAAAIVGAIAEALVGPLSPVPGENAPEEDEIVTAISCFCRRAVGL